MKLKATVLYADLADSTTLVENHTAYVAAEVYKVFLRCAAICVRKDLGEITAYDGDRIMAVYIVLNQTTRAMKSALRLKGVVRDIIQPEFRDMYKASADEIRHVVGIDTSDLFVAKTGIRGANDLVWVGSAANYAAKLAAL